MKVIICFLTFVACAIFHGTFGMENFQNFKSKPYIDIGENENFVKLQKVFQKTSTINVLLKNYEQPEGIIGWLENIFGGNGNKSFVVFNMPSVLHKREWIKECEIYLSNPGHKIAYYERVFRKTYGSERTKILKFEEEFETELDPQAAPSSITSLQIQEKFAHGLDKWWKFHYTGYIIFSSFYALEFYIGCLFNRAGTFLFIIDNLINENENYLEIVNSTFHKAWKSTGNLKLYILINKQIFTFNPFVYNNDERKFGTTQLFNENNLLLPENLKNLNGYPLNIEMFWSVFSISSDNFVSLNFSNCEGPDADVARMLAQQMNASLSLIPNKGKFGGKYPNGTLYGALGNLQKRKSDIALTAFFMKDYETRAAEFTYPLYTDRLCLVVKKAGRIPSEMLPLVIFVENLWIALFIAYILIAIIWMLFRSVNNQIRRPSIDENHSDFYVNNYNMSPFLARQSSTRQIMQIFVDSLMLFLSIPMRRLTRVQYERVYVASICLVSIIFVSIYQSGLATVYVRPLYFRDIDTLEKLDKSIKSILVKYAGFLTDVFPNDTSQLYRNLRNKMKHVETQMDAMDLVIKNEKASTVTRESTIWLDNFLYFYNKVLYIIDKDCPKEYFVSYMVPAKSPFLYRINQILKQIHRFGFIEKWINDFYVKTELKHLKTMAYAESVKNTKVLTVNDLKFPFYALVGGCILGIIVLIIEIVSMIIRRRYGENEKDGSKKYVAENDIKKN